MNGQTTTRTATKDSGPHRRSALFVGAFVSGSHGTRGISEDVSLRLASSGWNIVTTSRRPSRLGRLSDMLFTARRERGRYQVAAIDVYSGSAFAWAEAVCWMLRKVDRPYVLTLHGGNLPSFARTRSGRVKRLLASACAVTTPSRYLIESMQVYRKSILLIPNAIDIGAYPFRLRRPAGQKLVWLRAFHDTYQPELAVQTLAALSSDFPKLELNMVGPDKGDGSLEKTRREAQKLRVVERLTISGGVRKDQVAEKLAAADIFLNTSRADNTPVSVIEAMACGLCIVSTNVGGIPFLLQHERNALLVDQNDPAAMSAAVRRILAEPELAERLSRNARQDAERFDWSAVIPRWDALLHSVARFGESAYLPAESFASWAALNHAATPPNLGSTDTGRTP
jgi:glycosyltransferase involved in cell wall biosynthesis